MRHVARALRGAARQHQPVAAPQRLAHPGFAARRISILPAEGWVCSIMATASAPRGTGPPVAIGVAVPGNTGSNGATPQAMISLLSVTRTGVASPADARSAERTANPSTL